MANNHTDSSNHTNNFGLQQLHWMFTTYLDAQWNTVKYVQTSHSSVCLTTVNQYNKYNWNLITLLTFLVNMRSRSAFSESSFSRRLRALACFCSWCFLHSVADLFSKHSNFNILIRTVNPQAVEIITVKAYLYHRFREGDESFSCTCTTRPGVRLSASSTSSPHGTSRRESRSSTQTRTYSTVLRAQRDEILDHLHRHGHTARCYEHSATRF